MTGDDEDLAGEGFGDVSGEQVCALVVEQLSQTLIFDHQSNELF